MSVTGDTTDEPDETVAVTIGNPDPADTPIRTPVGAGTITDDDAPTVTLVLSPASVDEDGGVSTVTARLSAGASEATTVTVSATAVSSTGAGSGDFSLSANGTLTIAAGATASTGTVTVTAVDDAPAEDAPDKQVTVSGMVSGGDGAAAASDMTLTIEDDDAAPAVTLSVSPASISENLGVSTVTATLEHLSSQPTTVTVQAEAGFYAVGSDAVIVIAAGETANATDVATVAAVDDDVHQGSGGRAATVTGTAANAQAAANSETVAVTGAALMLTDDEAAPTVALVLSPASIDEDGGVFDGDGDAVGQVERGGDGDGGGCCGNGCGVG